MNKLANQLRENKIVGIIRSAKEVNSKTRFAYTTSYCAGFFGEKVYAKRVFLWTIINMKPKKLLFGVGVNDSDYVTQKFETIDCADGKKKQKLVWICPHFRAWKSMIKRCYYGKYQEHRPTYRGCTVAAEWHTFSNFKAWMEKQNFEGLQLDKDLLVEGNKIYSADVCVFVSGVVNNFTTDSGATRGECLIGTSWHKDGKKFQANCNNPFTGKKEYLGLFTSEQEAHNAWKKRKLELAHELAAIQTDPRVAKALVDRYSKLQISEN